MIPYDFNNNEVRTLLDDEQNPWFVAKDILEVLGVQRNSLTSIREQWKGVHRMYPPGGRNG